PSIAMRNGPVDRNVDRRVGPLDEPRRAAALQPVIRLLVLIAVHERLSKKSELVVDAVAESRVIETGERIEKTGGEPSETAVAERGIRLERFELLEVDAKLRHDRVRVVVEAEVGEIVPEGAAHEELHREVVQPLRVLLAVAPLALAHRVERGTSNRNRQRLQPL